MLRIRLFGTLSLEYGVQDVENLRQGKPAELFCFLLLRRERAHPREILASMLWGDYTTEVSKKYLRQALWQLQMIVRNYVEGPPILVADRDSVQVNLAGGLCLDVERFESACGQLLRVHPSQLSEVQAQSLRAAVDIYRGDLLEGWYQEWCLIERERLQNMYLMILEKLMHYSEERQQLDTGMEMANRILRLDRAREGTHQSLMRMLYATGDRAGAMRQYQRCQSALQEELGVTPTRRTRELMEQIRADYAGASMPTPSPPISPPGTEAEPTGHDSARQVLPHLLRVISILDETQTRIQDEVEAIHQELPRNQPTRVPISSKLRANER